MERKIKHFKKVGIALFSIFLLSGCGAKEMETEDSMAIENEDALSIDGYGNYKWGTSVDEVVKNNIVLNDAEGEKVLYVKETDEEGEEEYKTYYNDPDIPDSAYDSIKSEQQQAEAENKEAVLLTYYEADHVRLGLYKMEVIYIFEEDKLTAVVYYDDPEYSEDSEDSEDNQIGWEQSGLKQQYILKYGDPSCSISGTDESGIKSGIDFWRDDNQNMIISVWCDNEIPQVFYLSGGSFCMKLFIKDALSDYYAIQEYMNDGILDYGI